MRDAFYEALEQYRSEARALFDGAGLVPLDVFFPGEETKMSFKFHLGAIVILATSLPALAAQKRNDERFEEQRAAGSVLAGLTLAEFHGPIEQGEVIGRSEYSTTPTKSYLVRYKAGDGRQVEEWFTEDAIDWYPSADAAEEAAPRAESVMRREADFEGDPAPETSFEHELGDNSVFISRTTPSGYTTTVRVAL